MKKALLVACVNFLFSLAGFSQDEKGHQFVFANESRTYRTTDTVRIAYDLDSLEILYTNFGGCGGGPVYAVICHSDSLFTRGVPPSCDYLLLEYAYAKAGNFEVTIDSPGIYSVLFYVKNQDQKENADDRFQQTLSTPKFTIKEKR